MRVRDVRVVDSCARSVRVIGKGNRERLVPLPKEFGHVFGFWLADNTSPRTILYSLSVNAHDIANGFLARI